MKNPTVSTDIVSVPSTENLPDSLQNLTMQLAFYQAKVERQPAILSAANAFAVVGDDTWNNAKVAIPANGYATLGNHYSKDDIVEQIRFANDIDASLAMPGIEDSCFITMGGIYIMESNAKTKYDSQALQRPGNKNDVEQVFATYCPLFRFITSDGRVGSYSFYVTKSPKACKSFIKNMMTRLLGARNPKEVKPIWHDIVFGDGQTRTVVGGLKYTSKTGEVVEWMFKVAK